ncbi:MAG: cytochrome c oxidase subunit II [Gammaproteobacteria bacterium]|nr:cytochrome c oxidase subunit II [Gammaproteobacteria bacterium]
MGLLGVSSVYSAADPWQLNMYRGVTPISRDMYDLHMVAIYICAVIGVVVFGVMLYSLIYHRKSKGYVPATFSENARLEIIWSIIPFLILVGLAYPATRVLMRMEDTRDADVTIKIIGSQWKWQYQYLNEGISYFSLLSTPYEQIHNKKPKGEWYLLEVDRPLVLPINRKIRFLVTSQDVIHSWWVPEIGVKRDAIPGYLYEAWAWIEKPGTYRGQCAELCGINHGFMPIVVQALPEADYAKWVTQQVKVTDQYAVKQVTPADQPPASRADLMSLGKKKYHEVCLACHQANGEGLPPLYPGLKSSSISIGKPISRHIKLILNGVAGSAMQSYKDVLSDLEIAAIVTYERNAWGNNTNDIVQPQDVAKERGAPIAPPTIVKQFKAGGRP